MDCSYAVNLVRNDPDKAEYLDLYDGIQDELSYLKNKLHRLDLLKPFVEAWDDDERFLLYLSDLPKMISRLEPILEKSYQDGDQDAQEMIEAAVRDFLVTEGMISNSVTKEI
jgi:hypothetical protein